MTWHHSTERVFGLQVEVVARFSSHQTLTKTAGRKTTPAMAGGITTYPWSLTQLAELID